MDPQLETICTTSVNQPLGTRFTRVVEEYKLFGCERETPDQNSVPCARNLQVGNQGTLGKSYRIFGWSQILKTSMTSEKV